MPAIDEDRERAIQEKRRPKIVAARGRGLLLAVGGLVAAAVGAALWALGVGAGVGILFLGVIALAVGLLMERFAA